MTNRKSLNSIAELEAAADTVIALATRTLKIFSLQLSIAYNTPDRTRALREFLLANSRNQLHITLHDAASAHRNCPRLIALLRNFSHNVVICETAGDAKSAHDEIILTDDLHYVHRFHSDHARGELVLHDTASAQELKRRFEEIWLASLPAVTATTLGL
jgi:hypothetical protein